MDIRLCTACSGHGTCDVTQEGTNIQASTAIRNFRIAICKCTQFWEGNDCENDFNGCTSTPCSPLRNCTDNPASIHEALSHAYNCSPCPEGCTNGETDSQKCEEPSSSSSTTMSPSTSIVTTASTTPIGTTSTSSLAPTTATSTMSTTSTPTLSSTTSNNTVSFTSAGSTRVDLGEASLDQEIQFGTKVHLNYSNISAVEIDFLRLAYFFYIHSSFSLSDDLTEPATSCSTTMSTSPSTVTTTTSTSPMSYASTSSVVPTTASSTISTLSTSTQSAATSSSTVITTSTTSPTTSASPTVTTSSASTETTARRTFTVSTTQATTSSTNTTVMLAYHQYQANSNP
ncbi:hypothetical protein CHS0354_000075 [Potamilus streckersoni]|uniref:EGF-like domain-containing protein n=1 Tax=Potamilus streckersoni TaxID=2493646 RepID=A0AAE0W136_9BIVA|nr:hypothetical protein CHS0354_000075 [Potamilus streckersoni]